MQISSIVHDKILAENSSELQPARQIPCQSCKTMASGRTLFFPFSSALTSCSVLLGKQLGCPCFVGVDTPPPVPNTHLWTNVPQEIVHTQICDEKQFWKICKSCLVNILKSCPGILAVIVPHKLLQRVPQKLLL